MKTGERTDDTRRPANVEPRLEEVLADPLVHLVMKRDGIGLAELRAVVAEAQRRLRCGLCTRKAA